MFYVLDVDVFQKENDEFSENIQICKMLNMSTVIFFASEEEYNTHECLFEFMTDSQTGFVKSAKQS